MSTQDQTAERVPRRRSETRRRLLDAAYEVFVERGFGRTTVEDVCARAGYTRGAFYSNFASLDELFFEIYRRQGFGMVEQLRRVVADRPAGPNGDVDLGELAYRALDALDQDPRWMALHLEFTLYAMRNPEVGRNLLEQRRALREALGGALFEAAGGHGRPAALATPDLTARACMAVYQGAMTERLLEPEDAGLAAWARDLISAVATVLTAAPA